MAPPGRFRFVSHLEDVGPQVGPPHRRPQEELVDHLRQNDAFDVKIALKLFIEAVDQMKNNGWPTQEELSELLLTHMAIPASRMAQCCAFMLAHLVCELAIKLHAQNERNVRRFMSLCVRALTALRTASRDAVFVRGCADFADAQRLFCRAALSVCNHPWPTLSKAEKETLSSARTAAGDIISELFRSNASWTVDLRREMFDTLLALDMETAGKNASLLADVAGSLAGGDRSPGAGAFLGHLARLAAGGTWTDGSAAALRALVFAAQQHPQLIVTIIGGHGMQALAAHPAPAARRLTTELAALVARSPDPAGESAARLLATACRDRDATVRSKALTAIAASALASGTTRLVAAAEAVAGRLTDPSKTVRGRVLTLLVDLLAAIDGAGADDDATPLRRDAIFPRLYAVLRKGTLCPDATAPVAALATLLSSPAGYPALDLAEMAEMAVGGGTPFAIDSAAASLDAHLSSSPSRWATIASVAAGRLRTHRLWAAVSALICADGPASALLRISASAALGACYRIVARELSLTGDNVATRISGPLSAIAMLEGPCGDGAGDELQARISTLARACGCVASVGTASTESAFTAIAIAAGRLGDDVNGAALATARVSLWALAAPPSSLALTPATRHAAVTALVAATGSAPPGLPTALVLAAFEPRSLAQGGCSLATAQAYFHTLGMLATDYDAQAAQYVAAQMGEGQAADAGTTDRWARTYVERASAVRGAALRLPMLRSLTDCVDLSSGVRHAALVAAGHLLPVVLPSIAVATWVPALVKLLTFGNSVGQAAVGAASMVLASSADWASLLPHVAALMRPGGEGNTRLKAALAIGRALTGGTLSAAPRLACLAEAVAGTDDDDTATAGVRAIASTALAAVLDTSPNHAAAVLGALQQAARGHRADFVSALLTSPTLLPADKAEPLAAAAAQMLTAAGTGVAADAEEESNDADAPGSLTHATAELLGGLPACSRSLATLAAVLSTSPSWIRDPAVLTALVQHAASAGQGHGATKLKEQANRLSSELKGLLSATSGSRRKRKAVIVPGSGENDGRSRQVHELAALAAVMNRRGAGKTS